MAAADELAAAGMVSGMGGRPSRAGLDPVRARRRLIIDICRRRVRPGTGSDLTSLMRGRYGMVWPSLDPILAPIRWAVIGAVATRHYMPERATRDLGVAVCAEDAEEVRKRLAGAGWRQVGDLTVGGATWEGPQGESLDVLEGWEEWWGKALEMAARSRDPRGLPILPLPYLVLTKLRAGRLQDIGDVGRMLGLADDAALADVRRVVSDESAEDAEDLEALIALGRLETRAGS